MPAAALVELVHNFTLIHDDIEDDGDTRRGAPALHRALGVPMALNCGDALYTLVWQALADGCGPVWQRARLRRLFGTALNGSSEARASSWRGRPTSASTSPRPTTWR